MVRARIIAYILALFILSACCDKKSIPANRQALYSPVAKDRNEAALALARCGSAASSAVSRLSALLYDENIGVQSSAAYALRQIGTKEARGAIEDAIRRKRE